MNEDKLNLSLRKFLKNVGITSQRKIEKSKRRYFIIKDIIIKKIIISAKLLSEDIDLNENIEGEIDIEI